MAILPILDKPEAKLILKELSLRTHTTKELNEIIVNQKRECSTATLYRRLKELHIANVVTVDNGSYSLTSLGESLIEEIKKQEEVLPKKHLIDFKQKSYLRSMLNKPYSQHEYQQDFQKSPTEISDQFKQLLNLGLIELIDDTESNDDGSGEGNRGKMSAITSKIVKKPKKNKKRRGRPKKKFRLTKTGREVLKNLSTVDELLDGGNENEN